MVIIGLAFTLLSVCYVHQRVETLKAGYMMQDNIRRISQLIDRNSKLMYNLSRLESPRYLLTSLDGEDIIFAKHRSIQTGSYRLALASTGVAVTEKNVFGRMLDAFTPIAEAKSR